MGIIRKQSIGGMIFTYIGVILGFVNLIIITPKLLNTEEIGLLQLLVAISVIMSQVGSLGFMGVINRLFPYFRNPENKHHGFGFLLILIGITGFLLVSIGYYYLQPYLIKTNIEKSPLFVEYIHWLLPLTFFSLQFNLLDSFTKAVYNAVLGTFLKELFVRMGNLLLLILYFFDLVSFDTYVLIYVVNLSLPAVILYVYLLWKGEIGFRINRSAFTPQFRKDIFSVAMFSLISGFGGMAVLNIDKYMINQYLDLSATGIYSIAFYFSTLILMPNRSLAKIAITLVAESWKKKDMDNIRDIYYKSSINQTLIGMLLFLGIWCNVHNIFAFLPPEYEAGKYVILFIGIGNLVNMASGVSMQIIGTSPRYKVQTYLILFLIILVIGTNMAFIPTYGIFGAAIASFISTLLYVSFRIFYLYRHYHIHPFSIAHGKALLVFIVVLGLNFILPEFKNLYLDLVIRSALITIVFILASYILKLSEDGLLLLRDLRQKFKI